MESIFEANAHSDRQRIYWAIICAIVCIAFGVYMMYALGMFERHASRDATTSTFAQQESPLIFKSSTIVPSFQI